MIVVSDNSVLSCLAEIGTAGLLADAAAAGLIDFEDAFLRLSQTGFRLSAEIVESLRLSLSDRNPPAGT